MEPTQAQPRPLGVGNRWTEPKTGLTMVYVPHGEFMMGFENGSDNEKPVHNVQIMRGFWLSLTPATNAMYAEFVAANGYRTQAYWTPEGWQWRENKSKMGPKDYTNFTAPNQPRVGVTWHESVAFCNWLGLRLPTEAEWEYAARGPDSLTYPWGNDFDTNCVIYSGNSSGKTHPVGEGIRIAGASWCGALDLSGNMWEWVSDFYRPYSYGDDGGQNIPTNIGSCVVRGGSWGSGGYGVRSTRRDVVQIFIERNSLGFRCARF